MPGTPASRPSEDEVEVCRALVRQGTLSESQVERALSEWEAQPDDGPRLTLHQILIKRRALRPADLARVLSSSRKGSGPGGEGRAAPAGSTFGPYRVLGELGRGAMGTVFEARPNEASDGEEPRWGAPCALKILHRLDIESTVAKRFVREAQALLSLEHPHIVRVLDAGMAEDRLYIAMDLYRRGSMADLLERGELEVREGMSFLADACDAVDEAHELRFVHRDLKPSNILVGEQGAVVTDFGLVKDLTRETKLTKTGSVVGTPAYMAPEQIDSDLGSITRRTDVYALGVILYEVLTGTVPFLADDLVRQYKLIVEEKPVPPRQVNPGIPAGAETICLKALAKDPKDRYPSAIWMALDLRRVLDGETPRAAISEGFLAGRPRLRRFLLVFAIASLALLPVAAVALWLLLGE